MDNVKFSSFSLPTPIVIQPQIDSKSNKLIFRFGWISFLFGVCAFIIHYISLDRLANFSPFNAGIISGFFLMIAGLASVAAGYHQTSYRCFKHAQIWSVIVTVILAPGLIAVSITALILDSQDIIPICQSAISSSKAILFGNSLEVYPSNIPCPEVLNLFNLTQILNTIQLIIGVICFFVHIILLSIQRKVLKRMKMNDDDMNKKFIVCTQPIIIDSSKTLNKPKDLVVFLFSASRKWMSTYQLVIPAVGYESHGSKKL
jgi:hypothetical protein